MVTENRMIKWAKMSLFGLCGIALIALGVAFALNQSVKNEVFSANMVLNGAKIMESQTKDSTKEKIFAYSVRLKFPKFTPLLRSKSISKIYIEKIAWDNTIDTNAISHINQGGQKLFFESTQDLSTLQSQIIGTMDFKMDFYPLMKNILIYVILVLFFIAVLYSKNPSKDATNFALFLIIVALAFASSFTFWSKEYSIGTDSSVFQYIGDAIMRGEMPYKDAFDHKGPLLYLYNYFGNLILKLRGVWIFEVLSVVVAVIFGYKIARIFLGRILSLVAVIVAFSGYFHFVQGGNLTEQFALPFIFVCLYIFMRYFHAKSSKISTLICGICFGAVCLLRPNMIALWAVFVALIFFMELKKRKFDFAIFFTLGFALIVTPIFAWLYFGGAFRDFINQYILFNFVYSNAVNFGEKVDMFFTFLRTEPLMILSFIFVALKAQKQKRVFDYAFLAFIILTLIATSMSGRPYYHYRCVFLPIYIYGVAVFIEFILNELRDSKNLRAISISVLICALIITPFYKAIRSSINTIATQEFLPKLAVPKDYKTVIEAIEQHSGKNDKISVWGNDVVFYLISDRISASRLIYQLPIADIKKEWREIYKNDLIKNMPKIIILVQNRFDEIALTNAKNELFDLGYKELESGIFVREK